MRLSQPLSQKLLLTVPAIYFLLLGAGDVVMDIIHHTLTCFQFAFNLFFMLPLLARKRSVYIACGVISTLVFGYLLLVGIIWFAQYIGGTRFHDPLVTFGIGCVFIGFSFACAVSMLTASIRSQTKTTIPG